MPATLGGHNGSKPPEFRTLACKADREAGLAHNPSKRVPPSLDKVSPNNPVFLSHASGHAAFANAKAMQIAGVNQLSVEKLEKDLGEGGEIIRDAAGNPTGLLLAKPNAAILYSALAKGTKQTNDRLSGSICDALLAPTPGDITFPLALKLLGPGLVVSDDEVLDAMELAFREYKIVVEPGGAVALAAALGGKLPVRGRAVAVVCSGGNVDHATFARALARRAA